MRVYESLDGKWIVWTGIEKLYFNTQLEATTMSQKLDFASKVQAQHTALAAILLEAPDLEGIWADRDYTNAITDQDLTTLGITKAQLTAGITLFIDLVKFADNQAVDAGDRRAVINTLRTGV